MNRKRMKLVDLKKRKDPDTLPHSLSDCVICGDIDKIDHFPKANGVVGGYPCQGFSLAGNRLVTDPRNKLYLEFSRCIKEVSPDFFVAENVKGLITLGDGKILEAMINEFENLNGGYDVAWKLLDAKKYGVPQERERIFIVGTKKGIDFNFSFPAETHGSNQDLEGSRKPFVTLHNAIGNLHAPKKEECYGGGFSYIYMSRQRRKEWTDVSYTLQASGRHTPLHPSAKPMVYVKKNTYRLGSKKGNRRLSYKECARIQTFPGEYVFSGPLLEKYKQIGNAVPVNLAGAIAKKLIRNYKK